MTGCEIVVVLTLLYRDGKPSAISARPIIPKSCRARVYFRETAPSRFPLCPILGRDQ